MKLYVDMDGVLADFDTHHKNLFGWAPNKMVDNIDWKIIGDYPNFFATIPPMPDLEVLWRFLAPHRPTVLTGVPPKEKVPEASSNKEAWIRKYIGQSQPVICTPSKEKWRYASGGALLIDDWEKYKALWTNAGGIWITHTSAKATIAQAMELGL